VGVAQRQIVELALPPGKSMKARQRLKLAELRSILERSGYSSLDEQASALGLGRSTTWAILRASHKASGVSVSIVKRMLESPRLPPEVRQWINEYVAAKLSGAYGHSTLRLNVFRTQLAQQPDGCTETGPLENCAAWIELRRGEEDRAMRWAKV